MPSQQFLHLLHYLTPLGILHIAAFMTLCEAYMWIEPHINLRSYFFRIQLQLSSDMEAAVLGAYISVRSGPGVDPYLRLPMSTPLVGRWKEWFSLRNDTDAPLPSFPGKHPGHQANWGYGVAQRDIRKLWLLHDVVQRLLRDGLMGVDLLRTLVSHRVQPLWQWEVTMWRYPGPSCPDHFFLAKLADVEIDTRVRRVIALEVHQSSNPYLIPLREGVVSPWVSPLRHILARLSQFLPSPLFFPTRMCSCAASWVCAQ
jgi:hypothetical protein